MPNTISRGRARVAAISLSIAALVSSSGAVLAQSPSTAPIGAIDHPTDPEAVVLRYETCCGFTMQEWALLEAPIFTLYGDNTVVFRPQPPEGVSPDPATGFIGFVRATLSPEQVDALLRFALGPGGLQDALAEYLNPMGVDLPTTSFTIDAAGIQKTVSIQALSELVEGPDQVERQRFFALADLLDSFEEQVAAGNVLTAEPYQPTAYRGILTPTYEGAQGTPIAWPWTDVALEDFLGDPTGYRYAELTPEQVALVTDVPSGGIASIMVETPDGGTAFLAVRPLLPGEPVVPEGMGPA
jgi:hypothetical protein